MKHVGKMVVAAGTLVIAAACGHPEIEQVMVTANSAKAAAERAADAADRAASAAVVAADRAEMAAREARMASDKADRLFQRGLRK